MDVVCVEYGTPELAARALRGCTGEHVRSRVMVRVPRGLPPAPPSSPVPGLDELALPGNPGYGAACNRGASRGDAEWILFLNPDCFPAPGDLEELVSRARALPGVGALGPRLADPSGRETRASGVALESLGRLFDRPRAAPGVRDVDWVAGTCMLVRRRAFEEVGGFDERFFLYCEDADLCLRLRRRGWRVVRSGDVRVSHIGGVSFASEAERVGHYRKGRETYMRKHASPLRRLAWMAWDRLRPGRGVA